MSSYHTSSSSSSEYSAVDTIMPSRNSAGHMTQAGKTPRWIQQQIKVFEDEVVHERVEQSERPVRSGVTDFFMGVNLRSDAGRSEGPYNSGLTHVLGDITLQPNARGHRTEGGKGLRGSYPNLKQEFESKLQGSNTRKTYTDKRPPTIRTTTISSKRLPGTATYSQDVPRPTTSGKSLAGLMVYGSKFTPFQLAPCEDD